MERSVEDAELARGRSDGAPPAAAHHPRRQGRDGQQQLRGVCCFLSFSLSFVLSLNTHASLHVTLPFLPYTLPIHHTPACVVQAISLFGILGIGAALLIITGTRDPFPPYVAPRFPHMSGINPLFCALWQRSTSGGGSTAGGSVWSRRRARRRARWRQRWRGLPSRVRSRLAAPPTAAPPPLWRGSGLRWSPRGWV